MQSALIELSAGEQSCFVDIALVSLARAFKGREGGREGVRERERERE